MHQSVKLLLALSEPVSSVRKPSHGLQSSDQYAQLLSADGAFS